MRIALITRDYLPNIGGMAAHVYHLGRALGALGHQMIVVCPRSMKAIEPLVDQGAVPVLDAAYPWHRLRGARLVTRTLRTAQAVRAWEKEHGRADVIHVHDYLTSALAGAMLGRSRAYVWTNHSSRFLADVRRPQRREALRVLYGPTDGIIAASPDRRDLTASLWRRKPVTYIPNGVDVDAFHPGVTTDRGRYGIADEDFVVLCPSRLAPNKGIRDFALMAERLVRLRPDFSWRFTLAGGDPSGASPGTYGAEVRDIFDRIAGKERVIFLGTVALDEMPAVNGLADVVVLPSLDDAVSLAALEAMATGRPVVATKVGGFPELISSRRNGLLVAPGQPVELATAVLELADDAESRLDMGRQAAADVVAEYTWTRIASRTAEFYEFIRERSGR